MSSLHVHLDYRPATPGPAWGKQRSELRHSSNGGHRGVGRRAAAAMGATLAVPAPPEASHQCGAPSLFVPPTSPPIQWSGIGPHNLGVAVASAVGRNNGACKAHNQDAFVVETLRPEPCYAAATLVGVCDGHGAEGHAVAAVVTRALTAAAQAAARRVLEAAAAARAPAPATPNGTTFTSSGNGGSSSSGAAPSSPRAAWDATNLSRPSALGAAGASAAVRGAGAGADSADEGCAFLSEFFTPGAAAACLEEAFALAAEAVEGQAAGGGEGGGEGAGLDATRSGSTAVVCLILEDSVVAAWAGDSRAVVGSYSPQHGGYAAHQLTEDHKPGTLSEAQRIRAAGGKIVAAGGPHGPVGPLRVCPPTAVPGRPAPGLALSRAFGDLQLRSAGVIPTPDVATFLRSSAPAGSQSPGGGAGAAPAPAPCRARDVLIVASDSLWEVVSNQEAVELAGAALSPEDAAQRLLAAASAGWQRRFGVRHSDDTTVAVAFLP